MGAWGTGPFDNDAAGDFTAELDSLPEADRVAAVRAALAEAADFAEDDYIEVDEGSAAVAAAALVAAQRGFELVGPGPEGPVPPLGDDLVALALRALDRVLADESELQELWAESDSEDEWLAELDAIRAALTDA